MSGNLSAFQLGPGAVVQFDTNQGQILALVINPDSPQFGAPIARTPSGGIDPLDAKLGTNWVLTLNGPLAITVAVVGLPAGRAQWLQFMCIQGAVPAPSLALVYNGSSGSTYAKVPAVPGYLPLTQTPGAIDIISAYWNGTDLYALLAGLKFQ